MVTLEKIDNTKSKRKIKITNPTPVTDEEAKF